MTLVITVLHLYDEFSMYFKLLTKTSFIFYSCVIFVESFDCTMMRSRGVKEKWF